MYLFRSLSTRLSKLCTSAGVACASPLPVTRIDTESGSASTATANDAFKLHLFSPNPNATERIEVTANPNIDQNGHVAHLKIPRQYSMQATMLEFNRESIKPTIKTVKVQKLNTEYSLLRRTASV